MSLARELRGQFIRPKERALILHELRLSWRTLLRRENQSFTIATTATLVLAMTAVTLITTLAYSVLWAPLPFRDADSLVRIDGVQAARGISDYAVSQPDFVSWQDQAVSFDGIAAFRIGSANVAGALDRPAERLIADSVSSNLFELLGIALIRGGGWRAAASTNSEVMVSERFWRQRLRGADGALGSTLQIDGQKRTMVGVVPQDIGFASDVDLWLPMRRDDTSDRRGDRRLLVIARLRDGVGMRAAESELRGIAQQLAIQHPETNEGWSVGVRGVRDWIVGSHARERLHLLLGAVVLLMLVAFTNVANLQIARATSRLHELGVRQALGASRARLIWMLTIENFSLVIVAVLLGAFFGSLLLHAVHDWLPTSMPRQGAIGVSVWLSAGISVLTGAAAMLFGTTATRVAHHAQAQQALGKSGRVTLSAHATPTRDALVVVQFTLATALVMVSAMLAQNYLALRGAKPGFDAEGVVIARISLPAPDDDESHRRSLAHFDALIAGISALPGVRSVGLSSEIPMGELNTGMEVWGPNGNVGSSDPGVQASWRIVTADYLNTLRVPLFRGRSFSAHDEPASSALISAGLAGRLFPDGDDPVGQGIVLGNGQRRTIVGVVGDLRQTSLGEPETLSMYFPTTWYLWPTMTLAARGEGDAGTLINGMRDVARRVSPDHPLFDLRTLASVLDASVAEEKLQASVIGVFAFASLLLAALGIAGVLSYLVARRTPELALRMALGASHGATTRQLLARGVVLCVVGVLLGSGLALIVHRLLLDRAGPVLATIAVLMMVMIAVGTLASWWPLRRIARISPGQLLRGD